MTPYCSGERTNRILESKVSFGAGRSDTDRSILAIVESDRRTSFEVRARKAKIFPIKFDKLGIRILELFDSRCRSSKLPQPKETRGGAEVDESWLG